MSKLLLRDLSPGSEYSIQLRSRNEDTTSNWSPMLEFTTEIDTREPNAPTSVTWTSAGRSFLATWVAPTTLTDGSIWNNFDHFEVRITYSGNDVYYTTQSTRLDFTYEMNEAKFGTARSPLSFAVRAVSTNDAVSAWATPTPNPVSNPVPGAVTGLVVVPTVEQLQLNWTAPSDLDLIGFKVYGSQTDGFTPGPSNLLNTGNTTTYTLTTSSLSPWYFHVKAVDIFGQESTSTQITGTAAAAAGADTTPPSLPTSVTTAVGFDDTRQQAYIDVSWVASVSTDVRSYVIRFAANTASNWEYVTVDGALTTARLYVLSGTPYYVGVSARDFSGNNSTYANSATYPHTTPADTTAPSQPAAPTAVGNTMQVQVTHDNTKQAGGSIEADTAYYDVYASKTTGFTPSAANHIGKLIRSTVTSDTFPLPQTITSGSPDTWYIKVKAVDRSGNASTASNQATVVPGLIANINIADATITSAKITSLAADKITAGSGIIANLTIGNATAAGTLASFDYVAGTTGWKIGGTSGGVNILEINDGLVKARALELRNSFNLMPPTLADFEARRATYDAAIVSAGVSKAISNDPALNGGLQALALTISDPNWTANIGVKPIVATETGKQYIFSFYAKAAQADTMNVSMLQEVIIPATVDDPATVTLQAIGTPFVTALTTSYARYSFVFTGPAGPILPQFSGVAGSIVGNTVTIDALQIEEKVGALDTPSRWMPPSSTSIDGGQIRTGALQSSDESTGRPAWFIDMSGGAEFSSAKILGSLVVGTADVNDYSYIQSGNYDTATAGWKIDATGKAEFNDTNIRGEATLTQATVTSDLTISAEAGDPIATIGLINGSIQTIYGTLTSPPVPQVSTYDNSFYTINSQRDNVTFLPTVDYCGPAYDSSGNTYFAKAYYTTDGLSVGVKLEKSDTVGANPTEATSNGSHFFNIATYGITDIKKFLAGITDRGTTFGVTVRTSTGYRWVAFTKTTMQTSGGISALLPTEVDRDNGYMANWQHANSAWYSAYCYNTDVEENRVLNPTFNASAANWAFYNSATQTVFNYDGTNKRLEVRNWASSSNNSSKGATPFLHVPTAAVGDNIYVNAYVAKSSIDSNVRINIKWSDGSTDTSAIQATPAGGTIAFNAVAPVAGTYTVGIYFTPASGNWAPNNIAGYIYDARVANNKKNLRKVPMARDMDGTDTGWTWTGTAHASESHRVIPEGTLVIDKYDETTFALLQRNLGHQLYSDITGLDVGIGDYSYANVANPNSFTITRRSDPTQPSNTFDVSFISYVDPGTGIGTGLTSREAAYTNKDGIAFDYFSNQFRCYDKANYKVERLPKIYGDGFGPIMVELAYYHDNTTSGGIYRETLPSAAGKLDPTFARRRIVVSNVKVPTIPGTVASTDAPTSVRFYIGSQGTANQSKYQGNWVIDFTSITTGRVYFDDLRSIPRTTSTTLVPANNGASSNTPDVVNGFANVAGFVASKVRSANDLFSVDGNGAGRVGGLTFSELGLELGNLFGGTSGQIKSATGGFQLNHDGTGTWPLLKETKVTSTSVSPVSPWTGGSIILTRVGTIVFATGSCSRSSGFSTSFIDVITIPTGYRPTGSITFPNSTYALGAGPTYYQFSTSTPDKLQARMSAANANSAIINWYWYTTDAYP